ncbi:hypothetical protein D3C75_897540 [compost metagenome]
MTSITWKNWLFSWPACAFRLGWLRITGTVVPPWLVKPLKNGKGVAPTCAHCAP